MFSGPLRNLLLRSFLAAVMTLCFLSATGAETTPPKSMETRYTSISYPGDKGLLEFDHKIAPASAVLARDNAKAVEMTKEHVDRIIFRVKMLLDMYPPNFHFNIIVFDTNDEIKNAYRGFGMTGAVPIAFYRHKSRTIYLSIDKIAPGIFAHEVAHAVINTFFPSPPPSQVQEILAQYVDRHLWDSITPP
jgi:hypothetical protein